MKIYLDACSLSRLTDDQSQQRIREEAAAVETILRLIETKEWELISSQVLEQEVSRNQSPERRIQAEALLVSAAATIRADAVITRRAKHLAALGYGPYDALHLAAAEAGFVTALLTTDEKFRRLAARGLGNPRASVKIRYPVFRNISHDRRRQPNRRRI
jgi:predicted nucleic acid-binding protein